MNKTVIHFRDLQEVDWPAAGGKGGTLSRLIQAGYPVPDGFVILPEAFVGDDLGSEAWQQISSNLDLMRGKNQETAFAVRSSALAEDSAYASFAGEFETVLDVRSDEPVQSAIEQVHRSRSSERVRSYSKAKGIAETHQVAVVVQHLIRAEISGILFTADPVSGSNSQMTGNYVYGFGEELVSGEAEPFTFEFKNPRGKYTGPKELKRYAKRLYDLAVRLESELGSPQDIEWAIADGTVYILQSRPITTLLDYDPVKGEWNSSYTGDYAWVSSEVFPDILTPGSWSIWKHFQNIEEVFDIKAVGNICGQFYLNMSFAGAMINMIGKDLDYLVDYTKLTTGFDLSKIIIPDIPINRWKLFRQFLPLMFKMLPKQIQLMKHYEEILEKNIPWCEDMRRVIIGTDDRLELADMWEETLWPGYWNLLQLQDKANEDYFNPYISAREILIGLLGKENAEALLSNLVGETGELSSLGQLLGLQQLAEGEISQEDYLLLAGHRPPSENEISNPRFYEDPNWVNKNLASYQKNPLNYRQMLAAKKAHFREIWDDFEGAYPKQAQKVWSHLEKTIAAMEKRERIRSELTRSLGIFRAWYLRAGELTGVGEDIFFLQNEEVQEILKGDDNWLDVLPVRKAAHQRHLELAPLPMMVSGRFDPYAWAQSPDRRSDYFDSHIAMPKMELGGLIRGHPGSAGQVEGVVRIIPGPDQADEFQTGEILVASSTNVGWTPLFPRALAIITDIGAPLSHAAIVARELGIPAVVGTGNSTSVLKTGDRVRVDGSHGIIEVIEQIS